MNMTWQILVNIPTVELHEILSAVAELYHVKKLQEQWFFKYSAGFQLLKMWINSHLKS